MWEIVNISIDDLFAFISHKRKQVIIQFLNNTHTACMLLDFSEYCIFIELWMYGYLYKDLFLLYQTHVVLVFRSLCLKPLHLT